MATRLPKQTKDIALHVLEAFNELMHLSADGHPNAGNAFQELEDLASGWRRAELVDVVRHGFLVIGQWQAQSALYHRIDP
jgi:hypothetical protein